MQVHQWVDLVPDGSVRALKYSFGPGSANTFLARLDDGTWLAVSPGANLPESCLDEVAAKGDVSALVAPNAYHHMGQQAWRARFPKAVSYAADGSLPRLARKSPGVPYRPLDELASRTGPRVEFLVPPGMKVPDAMIRVGTGAGDVWFSGDLVSNTVDGDLNRAVGLILRLLGGGSGYRYNKVPAMVYLSDKAAWASVAKARLGASTTTVVLPAHGLPVTEAAAERSRALFTA